MNKPMPFAELVGLCRTSHKFTSEAVDPKLIEEALELSLLAPNHRHTFPWHYVWLSADSREMVGEQAVALQKAANANLTGEKVELIRGKFKNPEIIAVAQKGCADEFTSKDDYATLSCSIQLMALALREKGLSYKWSTGEVTRARGTYEILNLSKYAFEIIGFVMIGHAASEPSPRRRPALEDVLVKV